MDALVEGISGGGTATPTSSKRTGWLRMKKLPANWNGFENLFGPRHRRRRVPGGRRRVPGGEEEASRPGHILVVQAALLVEFWTESSLREAANHIVVGGLTVRHTGLLAAPVCIEEATFRRGASRCEPRLASRYRRFGRAHLLVRFCPKSDLRFCQNPKRSTKKLQTLN